MLDRLGGLVNLEAHLTNQERKATFAETALRVGWNATTRVARFSVDLAVGVSECVGGGLGRLLHGCRQHITVRVRNCGFRRLDLHFRDPIAYYQTMRSWQADRPSSTAWYTVSSAYQRRFLELRAERSLREKAFVMNSSLPFHVAPSGPS